MDWKRIGRTVCALLVVCCLVVNMSPIRAEASMITSSAIVSVAVKPVVISIIKGLGVTCAAAGTAALSAAADACISHLQTLGLCQPTTIDVFGYSLNGYSVFGITPAIINAVRDWLFDSETVKVTESIKVSGFSCTQISASSTGIAKSLLSIYNSYPLETIKLIQSLGINDKALIIGVSSTALCGYYFDVNGEFRCANFENPFERVNYSYIGVYSLSDLTLRYSESCYVPDASGLSIHVYPFYYSTEFADRYYSGNNTALAFDFNLDSDSYLPSDKSFLVRSRNFSLTADWSEPAFRRFSSDYAGQGPVSSSVVWDSALVSDCVTSDGLDVDFVAPREQSLPEGYSAWYNNSVTVQDPSTDNSVTVLPIPQVYSYDDVMDLTQRQIWQGTLSDAIVDANTGTVAGTPVADFMSTLVDAITAPFEWLGNMLLEGIQAIFVPSEDFLTEKVEALRTDFVFADSIIDTFELFGGSFLAFDTSPPVIYIDLGAASGSYYFGGEVPFVDLRWYAAYKPTVDILLSAFLWLVFLWRTGIHLPNIIRGVGGDVPGYIVPSSEEKGLVIQRWDR